MSVVDPPLKRVVGPLLLVVSRVSVVEPPLKRVVGSAILSSVLGNAPLIRVVAALECSV